jgi:hypothetical protein
MNCINYNKGHSEKLILRFTWFDVVQLSRAAVRFL